jgi:OOP family OmpA-OmpF porin
VEEYMKKLLLGVALGLVSAVAVAQDNGWYVGGALGQVKAKDFCNGLSGNVTCDDTDTTVKALGGYQFGRNFAIEFGAMTAGTVEARGGPGSRLTVDTAIAEATPVFILPVGQTFSVFGKFGLYTSGVQTKLSTVLGESTERKTNSDLTYGVGASWTFMPKFAVRAEWQRYSKVDAGAIGNSDADVISLGMVYRFY